ncbi:MAG: acetylxylan esterase [Pirellulales bacterium]|nr:acetylxylan esterase [Pirellulales bacterium]
MRWCLFLLVFCGYSIDVRADAPRVFETGKLPGDARLGALQTLNGHFPFAVPETPAAWQDRAAALRRRVLVANGLWPMPDKTPLHPVIHGKVERPGFTVERVYFESLPGHYVTGLLFRPSQPAQSPRPGVLSPHGHGGRLQRHSDAEIKRQIASGGEHFAKSGSMPKLARCAQLARMGCVTFIFDMLGYADSLQISREVAHRHQDPRPQEQASGQQGWIFYSPQADLRLQSIMGLQTWNAIRALDFLASLPDVDENRLAVTGGSGGGTQSILLGAIDDRIKVSFPNGMVSTSMQGGCYCENCNLLRVDTGNVELAALFAPKPQAMTAADDWTRDMMHDGYPQLRQLYRMLGNEAGVYCRPMLHFKHNYNYVTRATMYQWMNRHLQLGLDDPVIESDFEPLTNEETKVWTADHPAPQQRGVAHERHVCGWLDDQASEQLRSLAPRDRQSWRTFDEMVGGAWRVIFDVGLPAAKDIRFDSKASDTLGSVPITRGVLRDNQRGVALPLVIAGAVDGKGPVVVWVDEQGKDAAFDTNGSPGKVLRQLVGGGATVLLPDLLGQGEFTDSGKPWSSQRLINDKRSYSAFTFGYNRTLAAQRCGDTLLVIAYAQQWNRPKVHLLATGQAGSWAMAAAAFAGKHVSQAIVQTNGTRFADIDTYKNVDFVPGAAKYGDVPALMALRAPHALTILGETEPAALARAAYAATGAGPDAIRSFSHLSPMILQSLLE